MYHSDIPTLGHFILLRPEEKLGTLQKQRFLFPLFPTLQAFVTKPHSQASHWCCPPQSHMLACTAEDLTQNVKSNQLYLMHETKSKVKVTNQKICHNSNKVLIYLALTNASIWTCLIIHEQPKSVTTHCKYATCVQCAYMCNKTNENNSFNTQCFFAK